MPHLNSYEDVEGGLLSCDYSTGVDTRFKGEIALGPLLTAIDCSGVGGTPANTNCGAVAPATMNGTIGASLYLGRGTDPAKIKLSDMSVIDPAISLAEAATSIIYTRSANGTEMISLGMDNTAFLNVTTVGNTNDTTSTNDESYKARIFGYAGASSSTSGVGQIAALGRGTGTPQNIVGQNTLSGTVTMDASVFTTRATLTGAPITFTGFAMTADKWVIGTSDGPYLLDSVSQTFRPLIDELAINTQNCANMAMWSKLGPGVVVPLARGTYLITNSGQRGESIGPEIFRNNTSPVTGAMTAFAASELWGIATIYNAVTDLTYLCAMRPRLVGDDHVYPVSYFVIGTLAAGIESRFAIYTDIQGGRTLPTFVIGKDSDAYWFSEGRIQRFIDDTSYTYATGGTLYLTEMRRQPNEWKDVKGFWVETTNCTSTETVTLSVTSVDHRGNSSTVQVGATISDNGLRYVPVSKSLPLNRARFIKPEIALARGNTTTVSPRVKGPLVMEYDLLEPRMEGH